MSACQNESCVCTADFMPVSKVSVNNRGPKAATLTLRIEKMCCPTEETLIRKKLEAIPGVVSLTFNLIERKLTIAHSLDEPDEIEATLAAIGMQAVRVETTTRAAATSTPLAASPVISHIKWLLWGVGASAAIMAEVIAWTTGDEKSWPVIALALIAIAAGGTETYKKGWIAIKNFNLNINALMTIAVTGAVVIGQWSEAAMVMVLFALAEMIEARSLDRGRNAIRSLMAMTPDKATVQQTDGAWQEMEAAIVSVGTAVRVRPGERIPLDGVLTSGQSSINQAPITGESMPVAKAVGDHVFAGTINENGSFEYKVTAAQTQSTLSRIIKAVQEAQGSRAPTQRFVDQFARVYTPIVFLIALAVAIFPPLAFGLPWMAWIYKALVLLVIACPCALVISTPVTVASGLAAAARASILIKGGVYLEQGRKLKSLALDKTGTITQGKPVVTDVVPLAVEATKGLHFAAALTGFSDHPVSSAVGTYWKEHAIGATLDAVSDFAAITGRSVKGRIGDHWYYLGNHRLVEELGICNAAAEAVFNKLEGEGKTAVTIYDETAPLAVIGVADTVRETSRQAIAELHSLGVHTVMLTGDNLLTAGVIAGNMGIDDVRGNQLPEDKLAAIKLEKARYGVVGMVGDVINDAPALA